MIVPLDVIIFTVLIITAVLALAARDLLAAVALLSAYSLFASLLFAGVAAVDVALVEAALGAGLTGLLFILAILATTRHAADRRAGVSRWVVGGVTVVFLAVMLYASTGLPDRGDPQAPAQLGVSQTYLRDSMADTETPNVVTSLLADYRSGDTLGETMVILTAALAAGLVLVRSLDTDDPGGDGDTDGGNSGPDGGEVPR